MPVRESRNDIADEIMTRARVDGREEIDEYAEETINQAVDYAKSIAPVWPGQESQGRQPGAFRDSIYGELYYGGAGRDRGYIAVDVEFEGGGEVTGAIISDDPKAPFIEFGTAKTPEHGTFAKTAAHFNDLETHE